MTNKRTITKEELAELSAEELAEHFKENDLEVCLEPLSEWGSDLEGFFQKLEKGIMQWYEAGNKRSFTICFFDEAEATEAVKEETQTSAPLSTPAVVS